MQGTENNFSWFDPLQSFYGPEWDMAWRFGTSAASTVLPDDWCDVEATLESMWSDIGSHKTWHQARPAIYGAWRAAKLRRGIGRLATEHGVAHSREDE
jgi:hypothetical protein